MPRQLTLIGNAGKLMVSQQIERAASYYARATAVRAIHGHVPEQDAAADATIWAKTMPSVKEHCIKMVTEIFEAASPQPRPEPCEETAADRAAKRMPGVPVRRVREG